MPNMSRGLEFLLTLLVTMTTQVESRTITRQTGEESSINTVRLHRPMHFNNNIRTLQLQRPSISESIGLKTNFLQSDHFKNQWYRNPLHQQNRIVHPNYPLSGLFQTRRNQLREKIVRPYMQPVLRRLNRLSQRRLRIDTRIPNVLSKYSSDDRLQTKSRILAHSDKLGYHGTLLHASHDKTAVPGDLSRRTSGRNLRINLNLNRNGSGKHPIISVKSKDIRNIRLSHLPGSAIIDLHKEGRRTRITYSRKQQLHPAKAEVVNNVIPETPSETNHVVDVTPQLSPLATAATIAAATLTTATPTTTISDGIRLNETISVKNLGAYKQTTSGVDTRFNISQTVDLTTISSNVTSITQSHMPTASENNVASTPFSKLDTNDNSDVTTVGHTNDVTTEEPDLADTPDVDAIHPTDSNFRNSLYSDVDYD